MKFKSRIFLHQLNLIFNFNHYFFLSQTGAGTKQLTKKLLFNF